MSQLAVPSTALTFFCIITSATVSSSTTYGCIIKSGCLMPAVAINNKETALLLCGPLPCVNDTMSFTWQFSRFGAGDKPLTLGPQYIFQVKNVSFINVTLSIDTAGSYTCIYGRLQMNCTFQVYCPDPPSDVPAVPPPDVGFRISQPNPENGVVKLEEGSDRNITFFTLPECPEIQLDMWISATDIKIPCSFNNSDSGKQTISNSDRYAPTTTSRTNSNENNMTFTGYPSSNRTITHAELPSSKPTIKSKTLSTPMTTPKTLSTPMTTPKTLSTPMTTPKHNLCSGSTDYSPISSKKGTCPYTKHSVANNIIIKFARVIKDCEGLYLVVATFPNTNKTSQMAVFIHVEQAEKSDEVTTKSTITIYKGDHSLSAEVDSSINVPAVVSGVLVVVLMAVVAVVVALLVRRRRYSQNSSCQGRRCKMISTISGSKVAFFTNAAYSKEEKSELEEFPRKHIRFLDTIGKGTFGTVVMAEALNLLNKKKGPISRSWTKVAVKMTLISDKSNEELKKDFLYELALMKTIPAHVNIITMYASCTAHDPYLMILEYAQHGDLRRFLLEHRMERNYANAAFSAYGVGNRKERHYASAACTLYGTYNKKEKFEGNIYAVPGETRYSSFPSDNDESVTSRDLLSFALQICRGLEHLTRNKIVHRDVAARNVLLFEHNIVKISDFGLARKVGQEDMYTRTRKGLLPIRWMSPESLFYNEYTEKSDVWSYGVLLWELITLGSTPYPGLDSSTVLEKIRDRELLTCPPHSSAVVNNIVASCWKADAQSRPTFSKLCQDLEQLLEAEVEYVDLNQMNDHEYSTLDALED